jgi:hypothetical protein
VTADPAAGAGDADPDGWGAVPDAEGDGLGVTDPEGEAEGAGDAEPVGEARTVGVAVGAADPAGEGDGLPSADGAGGSHTAGATGGAAAAGTGAGDATVAARSGPGGGLGSAPVWGGWAGGDGSAAVVRGAALLGRAGPVSSAGPIENGVTASMTRAIAVGVVAGRDRTAAPVPTVTVNAPASTSELTASPRR